MSEQLAAWVRFLRVAASPVAVKDERIADVAIRTVMDGDRGTIRRRWVSADNRVRPPFGKQ